jgi:hypothetical protein
VFELRPLSREGIPGALAKAERYRLLNEPAEAESICRDVLRVEPDEQKALVLLVLALTDQFEGGPAGTPAEARRVLGRLRDEYERAYYAGIVAERQGKAWLRRGGPEADFAAYDLVREAMACFERAEAMRPPGNDDAILRWNACVRFLTRNPQLRPRPEEPGPPITSE